MTFCSACGTECAECASRGEQQATLDREVEMERLRTKRDIEVARITAGQWKDETETTAKADVKIAEIEAASGVEAAEAVAEAVTDILAPEPDPPADPPAPVLIDAGAAEPEHSIEPKDDTGGPPPPKKPSLSYWP